MANEKNLIPNSQRTPSERRENARKAGIASGKKRREKKALQTLLTDMLEKPCSINSKFKELAERMGLENKESIKKLFIVACSLNTLEKGNLADLKLLMELIGENNNDLNSLDNVLSKIEGNI